MIAFAHEPTERERAVLEAGDRLAARGEPITARSLAVESGADRPQRVREMVARLAGLGLWTRPVPAPSRVERGRQTFGRRDAIMEAIVAAARDAASPGEYVSGRDLARAVGVPLDTLHHYARILRAEGRFPYHFPGPGRSGAPVAMLSADEIAARAAAIRREWTPRFARPQAAATAAEWCDYYRREWRRLRRMARATA